jgi:16S rRNA (guanine966-N2)-methyltransferase
MRIIAGKHRGRRLEAPQGPGVRPTSERAREAVFDILAHGRFAEGAAYDDALVVDAFAGTGAMGLEALSRGARFASFLEREPIARRTLSRNIAALGEGGRAAVIAGNALRPPRGTPCDLAFVDPPYGENAGAASLEALAGAHWLAAGALVVLELGARDAFAAPEGFTLVDERRYGPARMLFLRYGG